jgi:beta-glucosidase
VRDEGSGWGDRPDDGFAEALAAADRAEVVILVLGLNNRVEGEEGGASQSEWQGDRIRIELPRIQQRLFQTVADRGKPIVLVLLTGSPLAIPGEHDRSRAVLAAWYPGQDGGGAIADALFGLGNPSGRLPISWVRTADQLPPFTDYEMRGRTYRFLESEPLYPFGYGLSYTTFDYGRLRLDRTTLAPGDPLQVSVEVRNTGKVAGDEIAQVYLQDLEASVRVPLRQLVAVRRLSLAPGQAERVEFTVSARQMALIDEAGERVLEPGRFRLYIGGRQPDARSQALTGSTVLEAEFEVRGTATRLPY